MSAGVHKRSMIHLKVTKMSKYKKDDFVSTVAPNNF